MRPVKTSGSAYHETDTGSGQLSLETQPGACVVYFVKDKTESVSENPFEFNANFAESVTLRVNGRDYTRSIDRSNLYNVNSYWEMVVLSLFYNLLLSAVFRCRPWRRKWALLAFLARRSTTATFWPASG